MAFEIVKTFVVRSSPDQVWNFLTDPEKVARCLPGAAITGRLDEKTWQGTINVKVGPVSSSYKGKVSFEKLDPAARTAEIVASGQDVRGKGGADLRLSSALLAKAPGETEVTTTSRVNITGILAQMGRGMVQDVSDQMFQIFSQRMRAELEGAAPAAAAAATAAPAAPGEPAVKPAASPLPVPVSPPFAAAKPEALDIGAIGARAALRAPVFWVAVAVAAAALFLLLR
ncbi:MAG TPA: SRPBCC family protein [Myxococcales bacterium]|nr:SRPBCC family protein [Myxococcales bacterium]